MGLNLAHWRTSRRNPVCMMWRISSPPTCWGTGMVCMLWERGGTRTTARLPCLIPIPVKPESLVCRTKTRTVRTKNTLVPWRGISRAVVLVPQRVCIMHWAISRMSLLNSGLIRNKVYRGGNIKTLRAIPGWMRCTHTEGGGGGRTVHAGNQDPGIHLGAINIHRRNENPRTIVYGPIKRVNTRLRARTWNRAPPGGINIHAGHKNLWGSRTVTIK